MSKGFDSENKLPGLVKITDNIYKVDSNLITTEETSVGTDEESLRFFNPRFVEINPTAEVHGFGRVEMQTLCNSIKTKGLLNPLVGRIKDNKVSLIEGHRRWNAISNLIDNDEDCYDPATGTLIPASTLYSFVLVRVYEQNTSEEACFGLAFEEDKCKVQFGSGAEIRFVHHCCMRGTTDAKILEVLGNTPEWLKETKTIIKGLEDDEVILQALFTDKLNRSAAKQLATVEDFAERRQIYDAAFEEAKDEADIKISKIKKSISAIENRIEVTKSRKVVSDFTNKTEDSDKYDDEIAELTDSKKDLQDKIQEITPVVNPEAVRKGAAKKIKGGGSARPKTVPSRIGASERISTRWRKFFEQLKTRPKIGDEPVNESFIEMCLDLLNSCTDKENNPEHFVERWKEGI
jgi:hypothetical protein